MALALKDYLQKYLRENATVDTADNMFEALVRVAAKYDPTKSLEEYTTICDDAISTYKNNWKDKEEGTDDRGHRLGESQESWKTISNVLQGML